MSEYFTKHCEPFGGDINIKVDLTNYVTKADIKNFSHVHTSIIINMSSSAHIDNNKKDILVLGKGPTQGLEHSPTAKKMYSINFLVVRKKKFFKPALQ